MSRELTRRQLMKSGVAAGTAAGAGMLGAAATAGPAPAAASPDAGAAQGRRLPWILDMVQSNPGEAVMLSSFNDAHKLARYGYNGQVVNEWTPPGTAVTFDSLNPQVFPQGSDERVWVLANAGRIDARIRQIHEAGLKALYFEDIITFPQNLVSIYHDQITDSQGRINLDFPMTQQILRAQLNEVFDRFGDLDGLVVRTGESYLFDVPYFTGNNPITRGAASHLILLGILRDEVCVKRGKLVFYRTWSFDGFGTDPSYYLSVAGNIEPHPNLIFSVKHTKGDFWRTIPFNPTIGIGPHPQIVEIECQREYEAKGATPDYVLNGVIDGFEEYRGSPPPTGLADVADNPVFQGIWTWSRGGGWRGPYIPDEMWCDLNTYVASHWAQNVHRTEAGVFGEYMDSAGLRGAGRDRFRRLALASATGVLHGHYSTLFQLSSLTWTRDQFLGGSDKELGGDFATIYAKGLVDAVIAEKAGAVATWQQVADLAQQITLPDPAAQQYLRVSSQYGLLLYSVIYHGWAVMLKGYQGDRTGQYDTAAIRQHLAAYDQAWAAYQDLARQPFCPTLYDPYSDGAQDSHGLYHADLSHGLKPTVDHYRALAGSG